MPTRERSEYLNSLAAEILAASGVDVTVPTERKVIRKLVKELEQRAPCHHETSRRLIARAMRRARGEIVAQWGGYREGAGRPPKE